MHKKIVIIFLTIIFVLTLIPIMQVKATDSINNSVNNNNYVVIIEDDADLLTKEEEQQLKNEMTTLTEFGNVMFKTTNIAHNYTSLIYIQDYYYKKLGNKSGVAFYIDMNKRQVCACASGGLDKVITNSKCNTIMDNVYTYAKKGDYYQCAVKTYSQMNSLLNGEKIAESMKYICNALLSIMISLFAIYGLFKLISDNKKASNKDLINECTIDLKHSAINVVKTGTHSVYSPRSDSSSSGGGSRRWRRRRILRKWWKPWILTDKEDFYENINIKSRRNGLRRM